MERVKSYAGKLTGRENEENQILASALPSERLESRLNSRKCYVLIRFAQTNVNYFPLKCNTYKTINAIWWLDAQAFNQVRNNKVADRGKILSRKSWLSFSDLKRFEEPSFDLSGFFLFFSAVFFAFLRRFSSSEFEGRSSDSYSWTPNQPSLLRSAIFINFCLLRIICWASCTYNPRQNYLRKFPPSCPLSYATKLFPKRRLWGKKTLPPIQCCFPQTPRDQAFFWIHNNIAFRERGEGTTGTATMFRKMLSKYRIFSTVLSKIVGIYLTWVVSASLNSGREKTF